MWCHVQLKPGGAAEAPAEEYEGLLRDELAMCEELLDLEPECKWVLAAAAFLSRELGDAGGEKHAALMEQLKHVDPLRKRYYDDAARGGDLGASTTAAAVEAS